MYLVFLAHPLAALWGKRFILKPRFLGNYGKGRVLGIAPFKYPTR